MTKRNSLTTAFLAISLATFVFAPVAHACVAGDPLHNAYAKYRHCIDGAAQRLDDKSAEPAAIANSADAACALERVRVMQEASAPGDCSVEPLDRAARESEALAFLGTSKRLLVRHISFTRDQNASNQ